MFRLRADDGIFPGPWGWDPPNPTGWEAAAFYGRKRLGDPYHSNPTVNFAGRAVTLSAVQAMAVEIRFKQRKHLPLKVDAAPQSKVC